MRRQGSTPPRMTQIRGCSASPFHACLGFVTDQRARSDSARLSQPAESKFARTSRHGGHGEGPPTLPIRLERRAHGLIATVIATGRGLIDTLEAERSHRVDANTGVRILRQRPTAASSACPWEKPAPRLACELPARRPSRAFRARPSGARRTAVREAPRPGRPTARRHATDASRARAYPDAWRAPRSRRRSSRSAGRGTARSPNFQAASARRPPRVGDRRAATDRGRAGRWCIVERFGVAARTSGAASARAARTSTINRGRRSAYRVRRAAANLRDRVLAAFTRGPEPTRIRDLSEGEHAFARIADPSSVRERCRVVVDEFARSAAAKDARELADAGIGPRLVAAGDVSSGLWAARQDARRGPRQPERTVDQCIVGPSRRKRDYRLSRPRVDCSRARC